MKALPNILTGGRLVLAVAVLLCLTLPVDEALGLGLKAVAFAAFVVASVTDFFDGWLARKFGATSLLGAVLDPIADKVLVAAAIVGLVAAGRHDVALPGGLILFREFAVSALRETLAPRGLRLPVTLLAKWKTTIQLVALGVMLFLLAWSFWSLPCDPVWQTRLDHVGEALLWLAAAITAWTGGEYALAARRALKSQ